MDAMLTTTLEVTDLDDAGGQAVTAKKDRSRLTVYLDDPLFKRFKADADSQYRSLSDHMNAILAEHYGKQDEARATLARKNGGGSK